MVLFLAVGMNLSAKVKDGELLSGNSMTDLGSYSIVKAELPIVVDGQSLESYDLFYESASKPVKIGIVYEGKSITFLVHTDEVEVQYVYQNGVFGVKTMDKKYRQLEGKESESKLDRDSYLSQRVITKNQKSGKEMLGLIACYFPALLEKQYQAQL